MADSVSKWAHNFPEPNFRVSLHAHVALGLAIQWDKDDYRGAFAELEGITGEKAS